MPRNDFPHYTIPVRLMRGMKVFVCLFLAISLLYACVVIKFDDPLPPPRHGYPDLKIGPHAITFRDEFNPRVGWEIDHYDLINQWGQVVVEILPNDHHRYVVRGVPPGCYTLRAIGRGRRGDVPSRPSNEVCTPGLKGEGIWL